MTIGTATLITLSVTYIISMILFIYKVGNPFAIADNYNYNSTERAIAIILSIISVIGGFILGVMIIWYVVENWNTVI